MALPKRTARPAIRATELTPDAARRLVISYRRVTQSIVKTLIFTIVAPGTVGVYIPYRLRGPGPHTISALGAFGLAPVAVGAAIYLWYAWDFATFGRGTPFPLDAPKQLVARGLYRFVRNPMYVGVLLAIFGQALWFGSVPTLWYGLAIALAFHLFVIFYEEPALLRQFGDSYAQYLRTVPRWMPKPAAKSASAK
jgi:protein-S-isoprenylcysteine O-methyltransferase Ste14